MRIGKQPRRFGGPSPQFKAREAAERAEAEGVAPTDGGVKIYLDDERPCPIGWTLARSPGAFGKLLSSEGGIADRVTHLSLDWYLGAGVVNGEEVVRRLAERFRTDPSFLPALKAVGLHSSDRDKAVAMGRALQDAIPEERLAAMDIRLGTPRR